MDQPQDKPLDERPRFAFDNSYARALEGFYVPWQGESHPGAELIVFNEALADRLGLGLDRNDPDLAAIFAGSLLPEGSAPLAQAYAGHQFGGFSPQLGDGRALLLGEVLDADGARFDIQLKGSGPTPFSRGGDGKAVLGPVLREYLMGEAMQALGIPTTRALAAVTTGEQVMRKSAKPGAVLTRIAASHIRVGTFQFFAARGDWDKVRHLADYAIQRHDPDLADHTDKYLEFFKAVAERQAHLVAKWMQVGFIHGVMNTDNMAISGETIDYGPCAFMEAFGLDAVFSSIDHHGRYAYGNQPVMARWNLTRLAETLLPLIDPEDQDRAIGLVTDVLADFVDMHKDTWIKGMGAKIGLGAIREGDESLLKGLFGAMTGHGVDFTLFFRRLADAVDGPDDAVIAMFGDEERVRTWLCAWRDRLQTEQRQADAIREAMNRVNPLYIPRNHLVEEALQQAEDEGNMDPFKSLLSVLEDPYRERAGLEEFAKPAPDDFGPFVTYCGT